MKRRLTVTGVLAIATYAAAVGIAVAYWLPGLWIVLFACVFMYATPHPALCHLICSASLVLMVLVQTGRIEWMSGFIPALGVVVGIVYSTKMCEESRKPQPIPKWESNGYQDRLNEGMIFVGDGD